MQKPAITKTGPTCLNLKIVANKPKNDRQLQNVAKAVRPIASGFFQVFSTVRGLIFLSPILCLAPSLDVLGADQRRDARGTAQPNSIGRSSSQKGDALRLEQRCQTAIELSSGEDFFNAGCFCCV